MKKMVRLQKLVRVRERKRILLIGIFQIFLVNLSLRVKLIELVKSFNKNRSLKLFY